MINILIFLLIIYPNYIKLRGVIIYKLAFQKIFNMLDQAELINGDMRIIYEKEFA